MKNLNLPSQDSATGRGIKTFVQAVIGFVVGLIVTVWAVPGVPEAVIKYVEANLSQVLLTIGLPVALSTGIVSFIWNFFREDIKNY